MTECLSNRQPRRWIATRLDQLGKTGAGLARVLGLPSERVSEIISGKRRVQVNELLALANYLEMTEQQVTSLLWGETDVALAPSDVLAAARRAKGMTQEALGKALGVSRSAVNQWEAGTSFPDASRLVALARVLELDVEELLDTRISHSAEETFAERRQWIATRLKELGKKKGDLASALGVDSARVSEILRGARRVQVGELSALSTCLDMPEQQVVSLLRGEADAAAAPSNKVLDGEAERFNEQVRSRLVEVRKGLGWSQARMATALKVPPEDYEKYETNSALPMYLLPRLVVVSGRSLSWLITGYG